MSKKKAGLLRNLATRTVIAALPVAMVGAYASGIFTSPPRLAAYDYLPVAEISVSPTTVGIATSPLYGQTLAQINQQLDEMQAIGVQNIRVFVPWGLVEQVDNTYDWSHIDDIMTAAAARNMGVLAEVNATPLWAGPNPNAPGFPLGADTPNVGAFTDFMRDFVNRYDETVSAYEIWNEPNYVQFSNPINPEAYAALLQAVYPVIKNLDPTATVVAGAVGTTQTSSFTMDPVQFVQRMLAAGAGSYFDALSVHPYGEEIAYSGSCPTCQPTVLTPREQVESIMDMLNGKKVWVTEYGLPTTPGGPFTQEQQAAWIKDLLDHWQTYDEDLVGPIFLYTGRDTPNALNPTNPHDYYGLWTEAGAMKAAAEMLKKWLAANQPGGPGNPGNPGNPIDPIAQFFAAVAQAVAQAIAQALANFFAQFAAPAPAATLVATETVTSDVQARLAGLAAAADATVAEGAEPASTVTEGDSPIEGDGTTDAGADPIATDGEVAPEAPAPAVTEPVVTEPVVTEPVVTEPVVTEPVVTEPVVVEPETTDPEVTEPATTQPDTDPTVAEPVAEGTAEEVGPKPSTGTPDPSGDTKPAAGDPSTAEDSATSAKAGDVTGKPAGSDGASSKSVQRSTLDSGTSKPGHRHDRRAGISEGSGSRSGLVSAEAGAAASDPGSEAEG
jgi:outer membrane biosynthesis protein TonB